MAAQVLGDLGPDAAAALPKLKMLAAIAKRPNILDKGD
jgi:hypothetical protein